MEDIPGQFISYDETSFQQTRENNYDFPRSPQLNFETDNNFTFEFGDIPPLFDTTTDEFSDSISTRTNKNNFNKNQPFTIIRNQPRQQRSLSDEDNNDSSDGYSTSVIENSKKISKKHRNKTEEENCQFLKNIDKRYIDDQIYDPNLDDTQKRKILQAIRNRVAAQQSRDKKKAYVQHLETIKFKLQNENKKLATENYQLCSQLREARMATDELSKENDRLRSSMNFSCIHCGQSQISQAPSNYDENHDEYQSYNSQNGNQNNNGNIVRGQGGSRIARRGVFGFAFAALTLISTICYMTVGDMNGDFASETVGKINRLLMTQPTQTYYNPGNFDEEQQEKQQSNGLLGQVLSFFTNFKAIRSEFKNSVEQQYIESQHTSSPSITSNSKSSSKFDSLKSPKEVSDEFMEEIMSQKPAPKIIDLVIDEEEENKYETNRKYGKNTQVHNSNDIFNSTTTRAPKAKVNSTQDKFLPKQNDTIVIDDDSEESDFCQHTDLANATTLFCPSGFNLLDSDSDQSQVFGYDEELNSTSDITKSKYLQLLIPKKNVHQFYPSGNNQSILSDPIDSTTEDDETLLEMRLKVYYVREFQADQTTNQDFVNAR